MTDGAGAAAPLLSPFTWKLNMRPFDFDRE